MRYLWILLLLGMLLLIVPGVSGNYVILLNESMPNSTSGWIPSVPGNVGYSAFSDPVDVFGVVPAGEPVVWKDNSNFFFGKPLNSTYLSYLGAEELFINFTIQGGKSAADAQSAFFPFFLSDTNNIMVDFNTDDPPAANHHIDLRIGSTEDLSVVASYDNKMYNVTIRMNYVVNETNVTVTEYDDVTGGFRNRNIKDVLSTTTFGTLQTNITQMKELNSGAVRVGSTLIYGDFDADYFRESYTVTPTSGSFDSSTSSIFFNMSAPVFVNATVVTNGNPSESVCADCMNYTTTLTNNVVPGYNTFVFNYSFYRSGELFTRSETINAFAGVDVAMCGGVGAGTSRIFTGTFRDELNIGDTRESNFTLYLYDSLGNSILTNSTADSKTVEICSANFTTSTPITMQLHYVDVNGTFATRQFNEIKIALNETNPINTSIWELDSASTTNYVVTLEETSGFSLGGYLIKARKLSGITSQIQMVASYITSLTAGQGVYPLDLDSLGTLYNFEVFDPEGVFVIETGYHALTSTSETIKINIDEDKTMETQKLLNDNLNYTFVFDGGFNFTSLWFNSTALINRACVKVTSGALNESLSFYQDSCLVVNATQSSGNINVTIPNNSTSYTGVFYVRAIKDGQDHIMSIVYAEFKQFRPYEFIGIDGLFWGAILIMTMGLIGIANPFVAIGMAGFTYVMLALFGFINVPMTSVWGIVFIVGVLFWALRKE